MAGEVARDEDTAKAWQEAWDALDAAEVALKRLGWRHPGVADAVQGVLTARHALTQGKKPRIIGPRPRRQF